MTRIRSGLWETAWAYWYVPIVASGAIMVFGFVFQYRGALRSARRRREQENQGEKKRKAKDADSAEDQE